MKTTLTVVLAGAAVAGLIYLLRDKEPVARVLKRSGDVLANSGDVIREQYNKVVRKGNNTLQETT